MAKQLVFAENDPVTGSPTLDGFTGLDDELKDGVFTAENDEPGYSFGGRATFDGGGGLSPAAISCVKVLGQDVLFLSFVVRLDLSFDNDDLIIVCLRPSFAAQTHDASTCRFDLFPVWHALGADFASQADPNLPQNTPDDTLPVRPNEPPSSTWHVRTKRPPRHVNVYRGIPNSLSGPGPYWTAPTNALPSGMDVKVRSWVPVVANGSALDHTWSVEMRIPLGLAFSEGDVVSLGPSFGIYVNMVRIGGGSSPLVGNYEQNTQYIWPNAAATVHDILGVNTKIDPANFGQAYVPSLDSPPGAQTGQGVQFAGQATFEGWDGVGARLASAPPGGAPTDTVDPTADNTLVAQVKNTGSTNALKVTADFHFANWGLGPGVSGPGTAFPAWAPANGAAVPTAPTTIPSGGATVELTAAWPRANIPPQLANTHQCVFVVLNSDADVQFVQDSVRRNMNFVHLSEIQRTAAISGKGYAPPITGNDHDFVLVTHSRKHQLFERGDGDGDGPVIGAAAVAEAAVVWEWIVSGYLRTAQSLTIGTTRYETWLPAPGAFGHLASHDDAEHDLASDLTGPGARRIDRGVYELAVPHNGVVHVNTVVQAAPASALPPTIKQGDTGEDVRKAQFLLAVEGYGVSPLQIDGRFGPQLLGVVKAFQRAVSLAVDGIVGPQTWAALIGHSPVQTQPFPTPLQSGASGDDVTRLQNTLNGARGWFAADAAPLVVDGAFGAQTAALARALQSWGAIKPDAVVSYQTWALSVGPRLWDVAGPHTPPSQPGHLPVVRQGDRGEAVQQAQFLLSATGMGVAPAQVDGVFGAGTHQAVQRFQKLHMLGVDGVVGPQTWKALLAAAPVARHPLPPTLSQGAKGPVVTQLQQALNASRWRFSTTSPPIAVDGDYGPKTVAAVRAFQQWGLVIVDGIVGYRTWSVAVGPSLWTQ